MRLFVAIEIPPILAHELAAQIVALQSKVEAGAVRWVRAEAVHLTLKFLGEVAEASVPDLSAAISEAAAPFAPFRFEVKNLGCFPNSRRPRVVWLGVHEPGGALLQLQQGLERRLAELGFKEEGRPFHPHLTVGRVKRDIGAGALRRLSAALEHETVGSLGTAEADGASLMRSDLRPTGAVYTRLHFAPLGASG